jgi:hypothetical protein
MTKLLSRGERLADRRYFSASGLFNLDGRQDFLSSGAQLELTPEPSSTLLGLDYDQQTA